MKKIIYTLFILTGLAFISSCKNALEAPPKSSLEESVIFSTPALAEGAIAGVIQSLAETNSFRGRYNAFYGVNNDTEVYNALKSINDEKTKLANYETNVNNGQMNESTNIWAKYYEGIERCNFAIKGLRTYGKTESTPKMAQLLGEFLTLRAVLYHDLIKGFGDIPARFEPISSSTLYVPRSDRDVIYKQLLKDLEEASNYLLWPNADAVTSRVERVNKAFAKGMRARLALAAGGFAQRLDGTVRLSTDPDLAPAKMFAIAKKECLEIIDSKKLKLLGFEEVFRKLHDETGAAGLESMWEIGFADGRGRVIDGLGIKHSKEDKYTGRASGGSLGPNPIMLYAYDVDDVRKDVSIIPYQWNNLTPTPPGTIPTGGFQEPTSLGNLFFGKYRYEWLKPARRITSTDDGLNWIVMRYSDVLLMAAESIFQLDGVGAAAPYLKQVRDRAFPTNPAKVTAYMNSLNASNFMDAIVDERALEFTGEMLRKADLIRWNKLGTKLIEAKTKLQQLELRQGPYANIPAKIYWKTAANGETADIYGLKPGETDAVGATLVGYTPKTWTMVGSSDLATFWDALYARDPNKQQVWPIWQVFLDSSNGTLNNKHLGL